MNKNTPFISATVFLLAVVSVLQIISLHKTNGTFCYPLDDTFIHMAVAKNQALHGVWGVTVQQWTSTSSSPLFTGLLALLYKAFGLSAYFPFVISMAAAILLIVVMQRELNRYALTTGHKVLCLVATLFIGAIPALAALGMEHTLQCALTLLFVFSCTSLLSNRHASTKQILVTAMWAALMVFTRYENAFVVLSACALLFLQKRFKPVMIIGVISLLPIVLFGAYAVSKGGLFVPNSIQIKVRNNFKEFLNGGLAMLETTASISGLIVLSAFVALKKFTQQHRDRSFWILTIFLLSGLLHAVFGGFGWFYRYEAYLIVLGTFQLLVELLLWLESGEWKSNRQYLLYAAVALLFTFNLPLRGLNSMRNFIRATYNIYEQQYQMALFIRQYYDKQTVAANDIGAISYFADINTIDLWGLGNNEVTLARKGGYWNAAFQQSVANRHHAAIAVIYESWFTPALTTHWKKIATWQVPYNYILGSDTVSFFAVDTTQAQQLSSNLAAFGRQLPKDVKVAFTDQASPDAQRIEHTGK